MKQSIQISINISMYDQWYIVSYASACIVIWWNLSFISKMTYRQISETYMYILFGIAIHFYDKEV